MKKTLKIIALLICGSITLGFGVCSAYGGVVVIGSLFQRWSSDAISVILIWLFGVGITLLFGWLCKLLNESLSKDKKDES